MTKPNLLFSIDVSGTPYTETIISCVCFNLRYSVQFLKNFKRTFKKHYRKKGKDLNYNQLKDILQFLDDNSMRSNSIHMTTNDWEYADSLIQRNKAYKIEKIFGILYFQVLEWNTIPRYPYMVNVCEENFMKIDVVISACRKIANMNHKEYNITKGSGKTNDYIKIADYVASAARKIKYPVFNKYKCCQQIRKYRMPKQYVKKVFY